MYLFFFHMQNMFRETAAFQTDAQWSVDSIFGIIIEFRGPLCKQPVPCQALNI